VILIALANNRHNFGTTFSSISRVFAGIRTFRCFCCTFKLKFEQTFHSTIYPHLYIHTFFFSCLFTYPLFFFITVFYRSKVSVLNAHHHHQRSHHPQQQQHRGTIFFMTIYFFSSPIFCHNFSVLLCADLKLLFAIDIPEAMTRQCVLCVRSVLGNELCSKTNYRRCSHDETQTGLMMGGRASLI